MTEPPVVTKIEVTEFSFEVVDIIPHEKTRIPIYKKGAKYTARSRVLRIFTDQGITGEYLGGAGTEYAGIPSIAYALIGRNALAREAFYNTAKQALKQAARMGMSQVDNALWDIAGKVYNAPVYQLLGEFRKDLPAYASTTVGDDEPDGLSSPEAYADFAEQCLEMGYPAFKIHPWREAPIRKHIAMLKAVADRVGDRMDLMLDPACSLMTFGDALKIGRACDDLGYFWYEDPYRDGGVSAFGHKKLRELIRTPLLQTEHIRGLEQHVDFIIAGGTDYVRIDPDYDGGITGVMKIAHASEGFGLDAEPHGPGPTRRHCMAAIRNCNYYELGLIHPRVNRTAPPVLLDGYTDELDAIDENGCVQPPEGPGLGVTLDWNYIEKHKTDRVTYE